jgi:hypothetical protein
MAYNPYADPDGLGGGLDASRMAESFGSGIDVVKEKKDDDGRGRQRTQGAAA